MKVTYFIGTIEEKAGTAMTLQEYMNLHGSVIVSSNSPREIGEILVPTINGDLTDGQHGRLGPQANLVVVGQATREEFAAQDPALVPTAHERDYFYELRTD